MAKAGDYLAEWLATIAVLVDKSTPTAAALFDAIPRGEGGKQRGPSRMLLFDVARGLAHRIPLTKLVELDSDVPPVSCRPDGRCPSAGGRNLGSTRRNAYIYDDEGSLQQHAVEGGWT